MSEDRMRLTKYTWPYIFSIKYDVTVIEYMKEAPEDAIWITRCSREKSTLEQGTAQQIYSGKWNQLFYTTAQERKKRFGTISDYYGLVLETDTILNYNLPPSALGTVKKKILGERIREQCIKNNIPSLCFWYASPIMSVPYMEILKYTRLPVFYARKLL